MASNLPQKIGKYDVIDIIGRGGMGVVYKAVDPHLDRPVAIKMITSGFTENPALLKRFFVEAKSLACLVHPNIVTVYDLGDFNGNPYLVMQYLEGEDLDSALDAKRPLSLLDKTNVIIQVCEGLSYAHERNVIHRDIKPANIMLAKDGSIKIFDFGIAKMGDQNVTKSASQIVGTLYYMSPEQVNGEPVDGRTDVFSTGVVLYQLVTSHLPFKGESTTMTLLKITREPPPPLKNFLTVYPPELEAIVLRALAKDREERYQSADELMLDLRHMQGHLKLELIDRNMEEVAQLIERADLYKAKERLVQVLRIDHQNSRANQLLREVQGQIQRQEVNAQVSKLRERAEEARSQNQFPMAQECLDRALSLDKNNTELQRLREEVREAAARMEKLQTVLKTAEAAHAEGRLDSAKEAVEEALKLAPDDPQSKALYRVIHRDWVELSRQRQMEGYLADARQQIAVRRFTAALEILKDAEALDPKAPQVQALLESASAGQLQERRRKELEGVIREVEDALKRDDFPTACSQASDGLSRFPGERTLLKLQALAEKQRQVEERKRFVDEQLVLARNMLQEKRNEELLKSLEGTLAKIGPEPRLQSLLNIVRENVQRERFERSKAECLQNANELLHKQQFDEALRSLDALSKELRDDPEIREFTEKVRAERGELVQGTIRRAQQQSSLDLRYQILQEALTKTPQEPELQEQLEGVDRLGKLIASIASEARTLEQAGQYEQALVKWEALRSTYRHYPDLDRIVDRVKRLRDQADVDTRAGWLRKIESAMRDSDYATASTLVEEAEQEYPWDADLMELKQKAADALKLRAKASKGLADGQKLLANGKWEEGASAIIRACKSAAQDRVIQERGASELLQAAKSASEKDARAAENLIRQSKELQPASSVPAELEGRIRELKKEDSLREILEGAKKLQAAGNLEGALRDLKKGLASDPANSGLLALHRTVEEEIQQGQEKERLERARQEKETFLQQVLQRAEQEPVLEGRERILEEALRKEPGEPRLQKQLREVRELSEKVSALANEASSLEHAQKYELALAKWETLRSAYSQYPDLDKLVEKTRSRQKQSQIEAREKAIAEIGVALSGRHYEEAEQLLAKAKTAFPGDSELAALAGKVRDGAERRADAQNLLALAMKAFGKSQWQKAAESFRAASERAIADPLIGDQVLRGILQASEAALKTDLNAAEMLFGEAVRVQPSSPLLGPQKSRIQDRKRERLIEECVTASTNARKAGNFAGALRELERGFSMYPDEPRLLQQRKEIQAKSREHEEEKHRIREEEQHRGAQGQRPVARTLSEQDVAKPLEAAEKPIARVGLSDQTATQLFDPEVSNLAAPAAERPMQAAEHTAPIDIPKIEIPAVPSVTPGAPVFAQDVRKTDSPPAAPASTQTFTSMLDTASPERAAELRAIEKELAVYLGPLARIIVKRAAAKTTDTGELFKMLAQNIERDEERDAFLAKQKQLARTQPKAQTVTETSPVAAVTEALNPLLPLGITPEAIDRAARMLAAHIGPISGILAKKAARRADSMQSFYQLLAEHVQNSAERRRFLRDAGFPEK